MIQISSKSGVAAPHFDETCIKTQIVEIIRLQKFPYVNIYNEKFIEENPYMRPMRYDYKEDKTIVLEDNEPKLKKQFQIGLRKIKYGYVDLTCDDGADDFFCSFLPSRGICAEGDERTDKIVSAVAKSEIAAAVK